MKAYNTDHWLDLFSIIIERMAEHLSKPQDLYRKLDITPNQKDENGLNISPMSGNKLDMDAYHEQRDSWRRVKATIKTFGLNLSDDLMLAPIPSVMETKAWRQNPWLEVSRPLEIVPVRFTGRDALMAFGFFGFFISQCDVLDPAKHMRKKLEEQGITAENWHSHFGDTGIANPFEATTPKETT